jgi:hypothetical protein
MGEKRRDAAPARSSPVLYFLGQDLGPVAIAAAGRQNRENELEDPCGGGVPVALGGLEALDGQHLGLDPVSRHEVVEGQVHQRGHGGSRGAALAPVFDDPQQRSAAAAHAVNVERGHPRLDDPVRIGFLSE